MTWSIKDLCYALVHCTYFLKLLSPLHCCTVCLFVLYCIVLCCIFCVSTLRVTLPSQIPFLCKLTWPIKPDSDSKLRLWPCILILASTTLMALISPYCTTGQK